VPILNETAFEVAVVPAPNPQGGGVMMIVKGIFDVAPNALIGPLAYRAGPTSEASSLPGLLSAEIAAQSTIPGTCDYPSDFVPFKPFADVVVKASVEGGAPTRRVTLRVGALVKLLEHRGGTPFLVSFAPRSGPTAEHLAASGTYDAAWRARRWPWFPEDFDWTTFQSAPEDQRVRGYLRGDELVQLDGHSGAPLRTNLPRLRPRGFLRRHGLPTSPAVRASVEEIPLVLDTLVLDADHHRLALVWRGHLVGAKADERAAYLLASESLDSEAAPLATFAAADRWNPLPSETPRLEDEGIDSDDDIETLAEEPVVPGAQADAPGEQAEVADALRLLREARVSEEILAKAEHATTLASLAALLEAALPKLETASLDEAAHLARAREFLCAHGADPALLERDAPPPSEPSSPHERLTREDVLARVCAGDSLAGADLRKLDLSGATLPFALLDGAKLDGADLSGADLTGADLSGASLRDARAVRTCFDGVLALGADFTGIVAERATFVGASLTHIRLPHANLTGARFDDADLGKALLTGAVLEGASLVRSDCDGAELQLAQLAGADATGASFRKADLTGAQAKGARLVGTNLTGSVLDRANFEAVDAADSRLEDARGVGVCFSGAKLARARAGHGAAFPSADFSGAHADDSNWSDAALERANFEDASLARALFRGAQLEGANLHRSKLMQADFSRAQLAHSMLTKVNAYQGRFPDADLRNADCRASNFYESEFWQAETEGARFDRSLLAGTKLAPEETP
jgi:uncharacterized protein YjbI with pentapeptide repeats